MRVERHRDGEQTNIYGGTVDDLIRELSALPADVRARRVCVFREGSTTNDLSIDLWPCTGDDDRPAVVIDCH